ncbi:MFS transporter [Nakamurella aerolata]|uniref:MFS transporter n=1 Tax=Nakamurella aerolata TaxID=1656892 RepID=UPI0031B58185
MTKPTTDTKQLLAGGAISRQQGKAWTVAVFIIFAVNGLGLASWMSRVPSVRDTLGASTFQMGLLIVGLSAGSMIGLAASSHLIATFGAKRCMLVSGSIMFCGLMLAGGGDAMAAYGVIFAGLFLWGIATACCDVAMNLSGAANEKVMGRTLMPLFHAFFSFGTMAGAGLGALAAKVHLPVGWHMLIIAIVGLILLLAVAIPRVQPESLGITDGDADQPHTSVRDRLSVWKQPTTLLIGLIVLGMTFAEGSAGDWLALGMVDDRNTSNATGALVYGVFVTAMTVGRLAGGRVLDRFGRVPVLRACVAMAVAGLALVIFVPSVPVAVLGTVLWGLGASLGFPVGMSAAADDPRNAAARVSAVATIGYLAFLVGPPFLGLIGEHIGVLNSLIIVLVLTAAAAIAAPAARERTRPDSSVQAP